MTAALCRAHDQRVHDTLGIEARRAHQEINQEIVMNPAPTPGTSVWSKLGRAVRFVVFLCAAGWLFPHACTEDMDLTRIQNEDMEPPR